VLLNTVVIGCPFHHRPEVGGLEGVQMLGRSQFSLGGLLSLFLVVGVINADVCLTERRLLPESRVVALFHIWRHICECNSNRLCGKTKVSRNGLAVKCE
jgi:hypothetical protein